MPGRTRVDKRKACSRTYLAVTRSDRSHRRGRSVSRVRCRCSDRRGALSSGIVRRATSTGASSTSATDAPPRRPDRLPSALADQALPPHPAGLAERDQWLSEAAIPRPWLPVQLSARFLLLSQIRDRRVVASSSFKPVRCTQMGAISVMCTLPIAEDPFPAESCRSPETLDLPLGALFPSREQQQLRRPRASLRSLADDCRGSRGCAGRDAGQGCRRVRIRNADTESWGVRVHDPRSLATAPPDDCRRYAGNTQ
jgi:hypothetical protein